LTVIGLYMSYRTLQYSKLPHSKEHPRPPYLQYVLRPRTYHNYVPADIIGLESVHTPTTSLYADEGSTPSRSINAELPRETPLGDYRTGARNKKSMGDYRTRALGDKEPVTDNRFGAPRNTNQY